MDDNQLPPVFSTAVEDFITWSRQQLRTHEEATKITEPLYHYTDAAGLCGIFGIGKCRHDIIDQSPIRPSSTLAGPGSQSSAALSSHQPRKTISRQRRGATNSP
jgi:hypothetical protein